MYRCMCRVSLKTEEKIISNQGAFTWECLRAILHEWIDLFKKGRGASKRVMQLEGVVAFEHRNIYTEIL